MHEPCGAVLLKAVRCMVAWMSLIVVHLSCGRGVERLVEVRYRIYHGR